MLVLALCLFFIYYKSGRFSNTYGELHDEMETRNSIQRYEKMGRADSGNWYSNKWEMYHTLSFENDKIVIGNSADTTYRYNYLLKEDTLWLFNEKDSISNKIKLHSNEELVFENFLDKKTGFRYVRKSR